ncbi:MAG TPA: polyprenyl synthetase family protein [Polyangiales bacterium]|nr:polyprenyl synthetase family protein [Polyangiales bacterium]
MKPAFQEEPAPVALGLPEALCREHGVDPAQLERALHAPLREFLARPGKAFRARLIEGCHQLAGGEAAPPAALEAIELLHAGSLIVDDIQDDADTRRGGPALHRLIGTPRALNAGNWLYFEALSRLDALDLPLPRARLLGRSAHLCLQRCHEGQALDLALQVSELRRAELPGLVSFVSALKTGALMGFAAELGATAAGADDELSRTLHRFGERVGVALQMLDDLGSIVCGARAHKGVEDLQGQRPSWVWAWASEALDELAYKQLLKLLERSELDDLRARLALAVEPLGRARVHAALDEAFATLPSAPRKAIEAMRSELTRLENSYG